MTGPPISFVYGHRLSRRKEWQIYTGKTMAISKLDQFKESVENITGLEGFGGDPRHVQHNLSLQGNASIVRTNAVTAEMVEYQQARHGKSQKEKDEDQFWNYFVQVSNDYQDLLDSYRQERAKNEQLRAERNAAIEKAEEYSKHLKKDDQGSVIWAETKFAKDNIDENERQIQEGETFEAWQRRIRNLIKLKGLDAKGQAREEYKDDPAVLLIQEQGKIKRLDVAIAESDKALTEIGKKLAEQVRKDRLKATEDITQLDFLLVAYTQGSNKLNLIEAMPPEKAETALQNLIEESPLLKDIELDEQTPITEKLKIVEEKLKAEETRIEVLKVQIEIQQAERLIELEEEGININAYSEEQDLEINHTELIKDEDIGIGGLLSNTFNETALENTDEMDMDALLSEVEGTDNEASSPQIANTQNNQEPIKKTNTPSLPIGGMG